MSAVRSASSGFNTAVATPIRADIARCFCLSPFLPRRGPACSRHGGGTAEIVSGSEECVADAATDWETPDPGAAPKEAAGTAVEADADIDGAAIGCSIFGSTGFAFAVFVGSPPGGDAFMD